MIKTYRTTDVTICSLLEIELRISPDRKDVIELKNKDGSISLKVEFVYEEDEETINKAIDIVRVYNYIEGSYIIDKFPEWKYILKVKKIAKLSHSYRTQIKNKVYNYKLINKNYESNEIIKRQSLEESYPDTDFEYEQETETRISKIKELASKGIRVINKIIYWISSNGVLK